MMAVLPILLLLPLTHTAAGLFRKDYIHIGKQLSWTEAREHCRNNYIDLAIISTQSELNYFQARTEEHNLEECWIGLSKDPSETEFTHWCDGTALALGNWKAGRPGGLPDNHCVLTQNNEWDNNPCSEMKKFFCSTWNYEMIVVQEMKTWEEALLHCRKYYTDLISITTETDHIMVNNRSTEILTPTFWTGLRFMDGLWFWVNREPLGSWTTVPSCPARPYRCGARNINDGVWENRDCEEKMNFICYQNISIKHH